jgi:hypothetical protein
MKLFFGIVLTLLAQVMVWFQINGQFRWDWFKDHKMLTAFIFAFPISILFVYSTSILYSELGGKVWTVRITSFGSSIISFYFLSALLLGETLDLKAGVCLSLSILIILIQIFWK